MSTKKTKTSPKTKRTAAWQQYFNSAIIGLTTGAPDISGMGEADSIEEITDYAATMVKRAETIADIADARNA